MEMHRHILRRHSAHWRDAFARRATFVGVITFCASLIAEYISTAYATASASNPVTDIILSNIPVFDFDGIYVYGLLLLIAFVVLLILTHPKRAPFVLFALALFIVVRSFFVSLTHLAPYPIPSSPDFGTTMQKIFFGGDLFFSGHTGAPFLLALIFWKEKVLRYIFLVWSIFFGAVVLLAHLHYSMDVAAAFFITYAIYDLAVWMFPLSHQLLLSDPLAPRT
ncbi:MAG TPA: phosphatase PAP2-related protein [Candidatus Paceibacterota bacterium]|nr:phosphatase PAP2-related protein [Candidatus Paceibacterota bacterium]